MFMVYFTDIHIAAQQLLQHASEMQKTFCAVLWRNKPPGLNSASRDVLSLQYVAVVVCYTIRRCSSSNT